MALQDDSVTLFVRLVDLGGNVSGKTYYTNLTPTVGDISTILAARDALIADLEAITDAVVLSTSLTFGQTEDTALVGAGEIENQALITCNLATGGKKVNIAIPAPADAIFQAASGPNYNVVDGANAALQAYLDNFETGAGWTLSDGEQLDSATPFQYGKRIHKASTRG